MTDMDVAKAREAKERVVARLGKHRRFAGVGITEVGGRAGLKLNRTGGKPLLIEGEVDGVPVIQAVVGKIKAL
jgi:hypothetical protein